MRGVDVDGFGVQSIDRTSKCKKGSAASVVVVVGLMLRRAARHTARVAGSQYPKPDRIESIEAGGRSSIDAHSAQQPTHLLDVGELDSLGLERGEVVALQGDGRRGQLHEAVLVGQQRAAAADAAVD